MWSIQYDETEKRYVVAFKGEALLTIEEGREADAMHLVVALSHARAMPIPD